MSVPGAAFYCVTGRDYFLGAVALLNSLRLVGHREPLYVLDCGMDPEQRRLLGEHATIVDSPAETPPSMQKLLAPRRHPAGVVAMLDADIIVTRSLEDLIARARPGRLVGFENDTHRHFASWNALIGLGRGPLRSGPYLISSALFAGGELARGFFAEVEEKLAGIDLADTWLDRGDPGHPLFYADQDVINALALARLEPDRVVGLPARLAAVPPFAGLRLERPDALRCAYRDGTEPYMLHHYFRKPWLTPMRSNPYSRLLTRLLLGDDVALRLGPEWLPARLRTGARAAATRQFVDVAVGVPAYASRRLGRRPRIAAWPNTPREADDAGG